MGRTTWFTVAGLAVVGIGWWALTAPVRPPADDVAPAAADPAAGARVYVNCQACHGREGLGITGMAPPLVGSPVISGPSGPLITLVLRGAAQRQPYLMGMPSFARLDNADIATVLTFLRATVSAPPITPREVAAVRLRTPLLDP